MVSIDSPGYYISYATSLVGSLNVDMLARESFASGKEAYLKLINYEGVSDYRDVYEYAGLMDPLSLEAFRYIF